VAEDFRIEVDYKKSVYEVLIDVLEMVSRLPRDSGSRHKQPRQKQNWLDPPCWALEFHLMSPQLLVGLVDIARSRGVAFKTAA
jgi:hypothetical protein